MRTSPEPDDNATEDERLPIVITATDDKGNPVRMSVHDVHAALARALPDCTISLGKDFWSGGQRRISLTGWLGLIEQRLGDLTLRVRELDQRASARRPTVIRVAPAVTIVTPKRVKQTITRDANKQIQSISDTYE
jgi:hypothetical protein